METPNGFSAFHTSKDGVHIWLVDADGKLYESHMLSHREYSEWQDITPEQPCPD